MGWFGRTDQVLYVLASLSADRDEERRFLISPPGSISVGLGGDEAAVSDDAAYFIQGQPRNLAAALNSTSYGLKVLVI